MARDRARPGGGTLILDSQGLSLYLEADRAVLALVRSAVERGARRVISGLTLVEVQHSGIKSARLNYVLSQLDVLPVRVEWSKRAAQRLSDVGIHGQQHAMDATVAVTAVHQQGPIVMLTSDVGDMARLCGERVTVVAV